MAFPIATIVSAVANFFSGAWNTLTPKKHVEAVNDLVMVQDKNYEEMRETIRNADDIPTTKKLELLEALAKDLEEKQRNASVAVAKAEQEARKVVIGILAGLLGGVAVAPMLIMQYKNANPELTKEDIKNANPELTEEDMKVIEGKFEEDN